ncbi:MAG: hypothetical protein QOG33_1216 [Gaiellales bacterium]|jgi:hypothetical protein|nr:hypothetical protein [Gaiellales bacterium]
MRRWIVVLAIVSVAFSALAATSVAQASVTWPASCSNMACVNAHLNNLNLRAKALTKRTRQDELFYSTATLCEGDALVNETQNEADNQTGITGEVGPIAAVLGLDCSTAFWPLFDPANFGAAAPALHSSLTLGGLELFRARMLVVR